MKHYLYKGIKVTIISYVFDSNKILLALSQFIKTIHRNQGFSFVDFKTFIYGLLNELIFN